MIPNLEVTKDGGVPPMLINPLPCAKGTLIDPICTSGLCMISWLFTKALGQEALERLKFDPKLVCNSSDRAGLLNKTSDRDRSAQM
jgi:hypothetical protein